MRSFDKIQGYDHKLFYWLNRPKYRPLLLPLCKSISYSANGPLYGLATISLSVLVDLSCGKLLLLGFIIERAAYFLFKNLFRRARPSAALPKFKSAIIPGDQFSFPSGHTSGAFLFAWLWAHYFPAALPLLLLWASLVGLSRVLLGVHFVTDIVAGAVMGSACALLILA